jgi:hypothetical protein
MKKYIVSAALSCVSVITFAQASYEKIMTEKSLKSKPANLQRIFRTLRMISNESEIKKKGSGSRIIILHFPTFRKEECL